MFDSVSAILCPKRFWQCEAGAVTVDWVVMTAAVVGLALGVWTIILESVFENAAVTIAADIEETARRR